MSIRSAGILLLLVLALAPGTASASADDDPETVLASTLGVTGLALTTGLYGTAGSPGNGKRVFEETQADAALFLASGGSAEPGAVLRELMSRIRSESANRNVTDLEIAEAVVLGANR